MISKTHLITSLFNRLACQDELGQLLDPRAQIQHRLMIILFFPRAKPPPQARWSNRLSLALGQPHLELLDLLPVSIDQSVRVDDLFAHGMELTGKEA